LKKPPIRLSQSLTVVILIGILLLGAFFRFYGIRWDQDYHLHPDERFLTMVVTAIEPVSGLGEYFNTSSSSLNPHNIVDGNGNSLFPFFVYGTFPLFIVRYIAELFNQTGYGQIHIVGRYLSGIFDLGTVVIIFIIANKLFPKKKSIALISAFLYTTSVLPIQISHFFIVDNFATFFSALAIYACVRISLDTSSSPLIKKPNNFIERLLFFWQDFKNYAFFSIALGMAAASKINAVVLALLLPVAVLIVESAEQNKFTIKFSECRVRNILLAALISFLVFRIFQPYAFRGPGFLQIIPNSKWIDNLRELSILSSGDSNYPPSLQWARRSFFFPLKNMVIWGLGLPLGVFSFSGLLSMGIRSFRGEWKKFGIVFIFTSLYLVWQTSLWNPTMRYFLLIYPFLAIMAAWFLDESVQFLRNKYYERKKALFHIAVYVLVILLVGGTALWALAFMNIYRQPMTRIAASEWIYGNVESAVNLRMREDNREFSQPLPYSHYSFLQPGESFSIHFQPEFTGKLTSVNLLYGVQRYDADDDHILYLEIVDSRGQSVVLQDTIISSFESEGDSGEKEYEILPIEPCMLQKGEDYLMTIRLDDSSPGLRFNGSIKLAIEASDNTTFWQSVFSPSTVISSNEPYVHSFKPIQSGEIYATEIFRLKSLIPMVSNSHINLQISDESSGKVLVNENYTLMFSNEGDYRGNKIILNLPRVVEVQQDHSYRITLEVTDNESQIMINGSETAKETDWDDALPLFMYGLNPFDFYEGIYASDLNFQMYWDDNQEKPDRFLHTLYEADYIFITSNRQWGSITQIEERYPLTLLFYQELIGCPLDDVQKCYRDAIPGKYSGRLGFDLVKTFQTNPSIFGLEFNSQYAEEAFTVYDHPKVLIFRKNPSFNIQQVAEIFRQVDLDHVLNLTPKEADRRPGNLMLGRNQMKLQADSGTWSELFNTSALINTSPLFSVLVWYGVITLLGWLVMPLVFVSFPGLSDKGIAVMRPLGLLFLSSLVWWAGSAGVSVTRNLIIAAIMILFLANISLFFWKKQEITAEIKRLKPHIIRMELLCLLLFLFFLAIRVGNPDLWHPYKGGEKPMDFSYLNAVIKSVSFPPYDPWFAGGYINYYYFGFVLAAVPIKLLGIIPSVGYNLVLASFFSFTGMAAFSLLWNLANLKSKEIASKSWLTNPYLYGCLGLLFILIIGNLGTVKMVIEGFQRIAITNLNNLTGSESNVITLIIRGIKLFFDGFRFPYYPGDWYWIPSRSIPGEPITEFPYFTFLYGDPHAHLFAYPFTLITISWSLSMIFANYQKEEKIVLGLRSLVGAILVGSLYATNTWDYPIQLAFACGVIFYIHVRDMITKTSEKVSIRATGYLRAIFMIGIFIILLNLVYYPFTKWFGQGYSSIRLWKDDHTPLVSYLIHWGYFLFIITGFLLFKLHQWLATTPLSFLKPYYQHRKIFFSLLLVSIIIAVFLIISGIQVLWVIYPLIMICLLLLFFERGDIIQRIIYLATAVALCLTLFVEVAVLEGDIGRMNTVFKFYLQAWTLFGLVSAFVLPDLIRRISHLADNNAKKMWFGVFGLLSISVLLFPITASADKIKDRMSEIAPLSIDGMEYMKYSTYLEGETLMDLEEDYHAIRWMQENITGTPVIVEANVPEYRWGNRFTIYTGLPGVLGWNWHQRQQRTINPAKMVFDRLDDITAFYSSNNLEFALSFIRKYNIKYIIVGQLERAVYPAEGLTMFKTYGQEYWRLVYSSGLTDIYEVKTNGS